MDSFRDSRDNRLVCFPILFRRGVVSRCLTLKNGLGLEGKYSRAPRAPRVLDYAMLTMLTASI